MPTFSGSTRTLLTVAVAVIALLGLGSAAAQAADPVIAAAGDIACGPSGGGGCRQMATSDLLVGQGLSAVLTLGDNQYECATADEMAFGYDPSWGRVKNITKPVPGNHEYKNIATIPTCDGTASGYFAYFATVAALPAAATDPSMGYYSYDIGGWHFIALNTGENCAKVSCANGSAQVNWLKADLAANNAVCTVAYFHYPRFSTNTPLPAFTQAFWDALYSGGADIVMSGHVHHYERFGPQTPSAFPDAAFGIRQFNVGTGGIGGEAFHPVTLTPTDPRWNPALPAPQYAYAANSEVHFSTYGVLKLTLGAGSYSWKFVDTANSVRDSGSDSCHGKPGNTDTTPPQVSITSPRAGATIGGTISVTANASDNVRVGSVTFYVDGAQIGQPDTTSSYSVPLDTTKLTNGSHSINAVAFDSTGNQTTSSHVVVTVDNDLVPPTVRLTAPAANAIVSGLVQLAATAADNPGGRGVKHVEFLVDGASVTTDTSAPYTFNWATTRVTDGAHTITARAVDLRGNTSPIVHINVRVQNVQVAGPGSTSIASIAMGSSTPTVLAKAMGGSLSDPAFSHSGTRLAYVSTDGIVVAAANGSDRRLVPGTRGALRPGWGAHDTTLVYISGGAVYRIPVSGGTRTRLATGPIGNLAVSPNGLRAVYQVIMGNKRTDLFVVPVSGGKPKNITRTATKSEYQPTWRDNATIAYARQAPKWSIFTIARKGGHETRITSAKYNCRQPAGAPDGKHLACATQVDSTRNIIRTFSWKGRDQVTLSIPTTKPAWPTWATQSVVAYVTN